MPELQLKDTEVRRVRVGCGFVYTAEVSTPAVFQVEPHNTTPVEIMHQQWLVQPTIPLRRYTDLYGNPCVRLVLPVGRCVLRYGALTLVPDAVEEGSTTTDWSCVIVGTVVGVPHSPVVSADAVAYELLLAVCPGSVGYSGRVGL